MYMQDTRKLVLFSLCVALAIILRGLEGLIPNPLPWVRIGLANIMTLVAILLFGWKSGLLLTILRVMIASFLFGTFLSPTFILSFTAGISSTLVMGVCHRYGGRLFSPIGISVLGGFTHNLIQLVVVYALLIKQAHIFYLFQIFALLGILTGFFNGWIGLEVYKQLAGQPFPGMLAAPPSPFEKTCAK